MDANQDSLANPYGMDTECENCPGLCETRENVLHGYGDVGGDFLFVAERPHAGADQTGVPFTGDDAGRHLQTILGQLGFARTPPDADEPDIQNAFLTYVTRCRHPDRTATDEEIRACEPYLNAEIRMINPEIIVPIGERRFVNSQSIIRHDDQTHSILLRSTQRQFVVVDSNLCR